jgi:hypothetical protein
MKTNISTATYLRGVIDPPMATPYQPILMLQVIVQLDSIRGAHQRACPLAQVLGYFVRLRPSES